MSPSKVCLFALVLLATLYFSAQLVEANKKGDLIIVGGGKGCGPALLLKTDKKGKGTVLVMSPCHKKAKKHYSYVPIPVYGGYEQSYGKQSSGGYEMSHDDGGGYADDDGY